MGAAARNETYSCFTQFLFSRLFFLYQRTTCKEDIIKARSWNYALR